MIQELTKPCALAVREVCTALGVSCSGFYAHRHKDKRLRRCEDQVLAAVLKSAFESSQQTYGSPRLVRALRQEGLFTSKTRVRRLMQSHHLCPRQKRRVRVRTTCSNPHLPVAPHLLENAPPAQRPGERFHSDITYIPTREGWLFTAATLDAYSRRCARAPSGWGVQGTIWKRRWCYAPLSVLWKAPTLRFIIRIVVANTPASYSAIGCSRTR